MAERRGLDTYCKAGGATRGYQQAGFHMVGVDIEPQPHYCGDEFIQADALDVLADREFLARFDFIHASPPCQLFAGTYQDHSHHPDLLTPTRILLKAIGKPYVIENIPTAPMPTGLLFCGATFDLPIIRHRRFEISPDPVLVPSLCPQNSHGRGVSHGPGFYPYARKRWEPAWRKHVVPIVWPWMTLDEAGQAIPPAYTEYIGRHLLEHLERAA
jgi:hypothetical protein